MAEASVDEAEARAMILDIRDDCRFTPCGLSRKRALSLRLSMIRAIGDCWRTWPSIHHSSNPAHELDRLFRRVLCGLGMGDSSERILQSHSASGA